MVLKSQQTMKLSGPGDIGKASLFPILLVNFIGTLGFSIILPFLVVLVLKLGGNELIYGIMGASYSLFQFIGAPILGNWSDIYGRKKILLLSQVGTFFAWMLFIIALVLPVFKIIEVNSSVLGIFSLTIPLVLLFIARSLDGITGGNVSVANAYLADITPDSDRKKNFGKMAVSANLGFIIGPAFAGLLGETPLGELLPVVMAAGISLAAIFVIAFLLPESNLTIISDPVDERKLKKILGQEHKECYKLKNSENVGFKKILGIPHVPYMLIIYFIIFLAFNFFYVAFPVHAIKALGWDLFILGIFFSVLGFVLVIVEGPVLSKISSIFTDSQLILIGSVLLGNSFYLFMSHQNVQIFIAVLLFSAGNGLMWPSFLSLLSKVAGREYQGAVQGFAGSAGSLASIIGLISGGILYSQFGSATFFIPGSLILLIFFLSFRMIKIEKSFA
jgi:MFS family permease